MACKVQSAVDGLRGLIVHHEVTNVGADNALLEPMAKQAKAVLGVGALEVVADAGYSNGAQFEACERSAIKPYVPANAQDGAHCALKPRRTGAARRFPQRHWHEVAFERMARRLALRPGMMVRRRSLAEPPFGQIKCWVMGDARLLLKGLGGARTEMALAVLARNLGRVINILGARNLIATLAEN